MKNLLYMFLFSLSLCCCNKDDDNNNCQGIDCLPPATQTGAGTFGCLVNGEPFVDNSGFFNCFYQLVDGEYYFSISGRNDNQIPRIIRLSTNKLEIIEGQSYLLVENVASEAHGAVVFYTVGNANNTNTTSQNFSGTLTINQLDIVNNIVSGTFNIQILDTINNTTYNITDGRFDAQFTQ